MTQELCCINFLDIKHFELQSDFFLTIINMALVEELRSLLENDEFTEPIEHMARIIYNGTGFTLNLIPGAIAGFLATLAAGAIFSVPLTQFVTNMFSAVGSSGSGYGYPSYQRNDEYYDQVRVGHSHWSRSAEILRSDWLGSSLRLNTKTPQLN